MNTKNHTYTADWCQRAEFKPWTEITPNWDVKTKHKNEQNKFNRPHNNSAKEVKEKSQDAKKVLRPADIALTQTIKITS